MVVYDPRGLDWDTYCAMMVELFASNQLNVVPEEQWREWVDGVHGIGYFGSSGIPDHRLYDSWQAWAENMVGIMTVGAPT